MTKSIDDILAEVRPREKVVSLCLRGDLVGEYERLDVQLQSASRVSGSLGQPSPAYAIAEHMETLRAQMQDASVDFRLQAIPPRRWSDLWAAQPDATESEPDESKHDAMRDAWLEWASLLVAESCVEPEMTHEQSAALAAKISNGQFLSLFNAVLTVSGGSEQIPFSAAASEILQHTAQK